MTVLGYLCPVEAGLALVGLIAIARRHSGALVLPALVAMAVVCVAALTTKRGFVFLLLLGASVVIVTLVHFVSTHRLTRDAAKLLAIVAFLAALLHPDKW